SWLHVQPVAGARAQIVDANGRTVVLRGVNAVGLEDDFYTPSGGGPPGPLPVYPTDPTAYTGTCPANAAGAGEPPLCEVGAGSGEYAQSSVYSSENDFAQMRSLGFDVARLPVSWSLLEPQPGVYDATYVDRVAQVVSWAAEQGVYVLVDMHQDDYSRFTPDTAPLTVPGVLGPSGQSANHADGAPPWAVMASGVPAEAVAGQGELNAYVAAAFTSFWLNRVPTDAAGAALPQGDAPGPGLQDHYIGAMEVLAKHLAGDPAVVGYDVMNEPLPGFIAPVAFDQGYLFPFYRRVIDALTGTQDGVICPTGTPYAAACGYRDLGVHDRHLFFVEPMAAHNLVDAPVGLSAPFTSYPGVVYAPHVYTHVFTVDTLVPGGALSGVFPVSYGQALDVADLEARQLRAALFVGEYGTANGSDVGVLTPETAALDVAGVGATLWAWKANCPGPGATGCWSVTYGAAGSQNGTYIASRLQLLSRVIPRATAGRLLWFSYDPANSRFAMRATDEHGVTPGTTDEETILYVPSSVTGTASVHGAALLDTVTFNPDGSRLVLVAPTGHGAYGVSIG
ncbi:MAG: cellulase family glycosylhydrolase, partial [Acidimicrobiales bacterium]